MRMHQHFGVMRNRENDFCEQFALSGGNCVGLCWLLAGNWYCGAEEVYKESKVVPMGAGG